MNEISEDFDYLYDYLEILQNGEENLSVTKEELTIMLDYIKTYSISSIIIELDEEYDGFYYIRKGE